MAKTIANLVTLTIVMTATAACGWLQPRPEPEFGKAVRNVMNSQINDYEAAVHPNPDAVEGSDPGRLNTVLETYRRHVTQPEEVQQPIQINVGGD